MRKDVLYGLLCCFTLTARGRGLHRGRLRPNIQGGQPASLYAGFPVIGLFWARVGYPGLFLSLWVADEPAPVGQRTPTPFTLVATRDIQMALSARTASAKRPVRARSIRAEDLVDFEESTYGELTEAVDALRMLSGRLKADGAKDAIDKTINSMIKYGRTRDVLLADLRVRIEAASSRTAENVTSRCVEALETRVMGVLDHVNKKLTEQEEVLAKLAPKSCEQPGDQKSTEVVKRPRGGPSKRLTIAAENATAAIRANRQPKPP